MNLGEKLKQMRKHYGYSQSDLSRLLEVPQTSISNYESQSEVTGMLDYIYKFCEILKIPVADIFIEDLSTLKKNLPDYITIEDAAMFKILNTAIDQKTRMEVKSAFVNIMKAVLIQYADRLEHMPEYKKLFGDTEYTQNEETHSSLHDEDEKKKV